MRVPTLHEQVPASSAAEPRRAVGSMRRRLFVVVGCACAAALALVPLLGRSEPPLPELGRLAPFRLTSEAGRPFGAAELDGRVWVAGFVFTRCPTVCPVISATMAELQREARGAGLHGRFQLVSFSVDPAYDTPARLRAYADRYGADPGLWTFLTGDLGAMSETVTAGLKIAMGDVASARDLTAVMHGTHFVLVDGARRIRGYYASSDPDVVRRVIKDAQRLVAAGGAS